MKRKFLPSFCRRGFLAQRLLDQLNSRDKNLRAEAMREARTLTPEELLQCVKFSGTFKIWHDRKYASALINITTLLLKRKM